MLPLKSIKTIFFDYDGTIHNSIGIYAPAFRKAYDFLVKQGAAESREWSDREISYWLGFNPQDMWQTFMPNLSEDLRAKGSSIIGEEMKYQIQAGKPVLYPGALETLAYLKDRGYHLVFISNCKTDYKECHTTLFALDRYFDRLVCADDYDFIPKHDILKAIKDDFPKDMVIVGDRQQDIEAGMKNDIYTIACTYGFALEGELDKADMLIVDIGELTNYF